jgi:hypothetical protein
MHGPSLAEWLGRFWLNEKFFRQKKKPGQLPGL